MPTITQLKVAGMTCGHCVAAVTAELSRLDGVERVDVDLDTGAVTIASRTGLDRHEIAEAVAEAGYEVEP